jgi:hypothetical protein
VSACTRSLAGKAALFLCAACCLSGEHAGAVTNLLSSFQAGTGDFQLGTLTVGSVNGSSNLQIVVPYCTTSGQWYLDAFTWQGTRLPGFPWSDGSNSIINTSPTLYDINGDGTIEILFTCGTKVIALNGTGHVIWSSDVNRLDYVPTGGFQVVTNGFYWYPTGEWLSNLPATSIFYSQVSPPIVADIARTGFKEVVTAWKINPDSTGGGQDYNPFISPIWGSGEWGTMGEDWSGGVVFHNATNGAQDYVYHIDQLVESGLALGHATTNAPWDVYVLNDSDSIASFDRTKPHGLWGRGSLQGMFGKNQQLMSGSYELPVDVYTADIAGDGLSEVLVPMTRVPSFHQPGDTVLDHDGAIMWREWRQTANFTNVHGWLNSACMIPVNPDHDNHIDVLTFAHSFEIDYSYWNGVDLVDHPGWPISFYPLLPTPPVVGDVDGDGQQEIIIGTYDPCVYPSSGSLYIFALDGTLKQSIPIPGGIKQIPSLADVNNDGSLDVIFRSTEGVVYVENFGATDATNVSWATHRGNAQHDGKSGVSLFPPGTPLITSKSSGYATTTFGWGGTGTNTATEYRIYRATNANCPFRRLMTLPNTFTSYTDGGLVEGLQYFYEVAALQSGQEVLSAPFALTPLLNSNLLANGAMEENDNSHWDKWFTGDIDWTNMIASTNVAYEGLQSMEILLNTNGDDGTISQFNEYGIPDSVLPVTPGTLYSFGGFMCSGGLTEPMQQWFEWSSSPTALDTNQPPARLYPYYYTPYFNAGTAPTGWVYANQTVTMPSGFSCVDFWHRYTVNNLVSGSIFLDNLFFRPLPNPAAGEWTEVLQFGSTWKYSFVTPSGNWYSPSYSDALWLQGQAKFGAGSGPQNIQTILLPLLPAYYFRTTFNIPSTNLGELLLSATCTQNSAGQSMQVYLNGQLVPATDIAAVSQQGNQVLYFDLAPFINLLKTGPNLIAAVLYNTPELGYNDIAFDLDLKVIGAPVANGFAQIVSVTPGFNEVTLAVRAPGNSIWAAQSTESLANPQNWQLVQSFTNAVPTTVTIEDTGQNGRKAPALVSARYYRVVPN